MASSSSSLDPRNYAMDGEIRELFDALISKMDKLIASLSPLLSEPQIPPLSVITETPKISYHPSPPSCNIPKTTKQPNTHNPKKPDQKIPTKQTNITSCHRHPSPRLQHRQSTQRSHQDPSRYHSFVQQPQLRTDFHNRRSRNRRTKTSPLRRYLCLTISIHGRVIRIILSSHQFKRDSFVDRKSVV